jgi:CRP-like cAMP-binding protein
VNEVQPFAAFCVAAPLRVPAHCCPSLYLIRVQTAILLLLKQEIGEPSKFGTRLSVRLTHEDLANACCTTRVTMTRVLGELQQQGKIIFDCDRRIILTETLL